MGRRPYSQRPTVERLARDSLDIRELERLGPAAEWPYQRFCAGLNRKDHHHAELAHPQASRPSNFQRSI
jgi:hypothetical protein